MYEWKLKDSIENSLALDFFIEHQFEFGSKQRGCIIKNALDEFLHPLIVT